MSYKKAAYALPDTLLAQVQKYVDGECIYIPRKPDHKKRWGDGTSTRDELLKRNRLIYADYVAGNNGQELSQKFFLSLKSIQRIIRDQKKSNST